MSQGITKKEGERLAAQAQERKVKHQANLEFKQASREQTQRRMARAIESEAVAKAHYRANPTTSNYRFWKAAARRACS